MAKRKKMRRAYLKPYAAHGVKVKHGTVRGLTNTAPEMGTATEIDPLWFTIPAEKRPWALRNIHPDDNVPIPRGDIRNSGLSPADFRERMKSRGFVQGSMYNPDDLPRIREGKEVPKPKPHVSEETGKWHGAVNDPVQAVIDRRHEIMWDELHPESLQDKINLLWSNNFRSGISSFIRKHISGSKIELWLYFNSAERKSFFIQINHLDRVIKQSIVYGNYTVAIRNLGRITWKRIEPFPP